MFLKAGVLALSAFSLSVMNTELIDLSSLKLGICSELIFIVLHTKISAINYKEKILEYLDEYAEARTQDISLYIGLKLSRTKDYLSELVEEGNIIANGANKNRTYSLKK